MRLGEFIRENSERILADWEEFARTHTVAGEAMDVEALRDHAAAMLEAITRDMAQPQTTAERRTKSRGDRSAEPGAPLTAAEEHGADRADSGFTLAEMVSEYRALRATVIRLWSESKRQLDGVDLEDLTRFNEGIDQALAESVTRYSDDLAESRSMFLAILGHDLRTPLSAVITASDFLAESEELSPGSRTLAERIRSSGRRMNGLVNDLIDLTRSRLGTGIPITRAAADLGRIASDAVDEIRAAHPDCEVQFTIAGDASGRWDTARLSQAVSNLLTNAVQHGGAAVPVTVKVEGREQDVLLDVCNGGDPIPEREVERIFSPWTQVASPGARTEAGGLGLGLYIAREIARAHGGDIGVESTAETGTRFRARLPR